MNCPNCDTPVRITKRRTRPGEATHERLTCPDCGWSAAGKVVV